MPPAAVLVWTFACFRPGVIENSRAASRRGRRRLHMFSATIKVGQRPSGEYYLIHLTDLTGGIIRAQRRLASQRPEEADSDETSSWAQASRSPRKTINLKIETGKEIPGNSRRMIQLSTARNHGACGRFAQYLSRFQECHRQRLEGPAKVSMDRTSSFFDIFASSAFLVNLFRNGKHDAIQRMILLCKNFHLRLRQS